MRKAASRLLAAGVFVSIGVLAAACGSPSTPGVASLSGTPGNPSHAATSTSTSTSSGSGTFASATKRHVALEFAKCMRKHGVKNFPEGKGPISLSPSSGLDPNSPTFRAAQQACQSLLPKPSPAQIKKAEQNALRFSKCMRAHGVTNFPDPQFSSTGGGFAIRISGSKGSLDPNSPAYQAAQNACSKDLHLPKGAKLGPGKQGSGAVAVP